MAKESVIVFAGEDKFIAKKDRDFNKQTGFSNLVGANGDNVVPQEITPNPLTPPDKVAVPSPTDSDFCEKAQQFISTNGNGTATPDEVMSVYAAFQANCQRPQPDVEPSLLTVDWASLSSCDEVTAKVRDLENLLATSRMPQDQRARYEAALERGRMAQTEKCGVTPPALPDVPPPPPTPPTGTGVVLSGLGVPPARGGGAPSGGGEKKVEKKSNLWIWLIVAAGAYLLLSSNKKN